MGRCQQWTTLATISKELLSRLAQQKLFNSYLKAKHFRTPLPGLQKRENSTGTSFLRTRTCFFLRHKSSDDPHGFIRALEEASAHAEQERRTLEASIRNLMEAVDFYAWEYLRELGEGYIEEKKPVDRYFLNMSELLKKSFLEDVYVYQHVALAASHVFDNYPETQIAQIILNDQNHEHAFRIEGPGVSVDIGELADPDHYADAFMRLKNSGVFGMQADRDDSDDLKFHKPMPAGELLGHNKLLVRNHNRELKRFVELFADKEAY